MPPARLSCTQVPCTVLTRLSFWFRMSIPVALPYTSMPSITVPAPFVRLIVPVPRAMVSLKEITRLLLIATPLLVVVASLARAEFRWRGVLVAAAVLTAGTWALCVWGLQLDWPLLPAGLG